ncbi:MAG: polyketide cyclase [Bacteriovoracaceae bacterium]|nr:polyketide cyclase [Bacteriovoracaceae bacterium]
MLILKIIFTLIVLIGLVVGYAALQPSDYKISREVKINTSASIPFALTNDPRKFDSWNPWRKGDPDAKEWFEGSASGVGAITQWQDGKKIGTGSSTIIESVPNSTIGVRLDYKKPFEGTQMAEFAFREEGKQTVVSWSVSGKSNLIQKIFCMLFMNMEKMIGETFEKGLKDLKVLSEAEVKK